ncbi:hypothetical protein EVAR_79681_1 [Eumeta japonica]|uniref:Uncharacterized protein n=1 Tax=Eumeta variegata TaxID=151549 RepID=A0A4C1TBN6_EUMVA|nr:hypothetical protein EVAR_79681_1 [Eumeta japonica]
MVMAAAGRDISSPGPAPPTASGGIRMKRDRGSVVKRKCSEPPPEGAAAGDEGDTRRAGAAVGTRARLII